jgi:hypothetical protein
MGRPPKLTPQQLKEAQRRRAKGATLKELAKNYNVGQIALHQAKRNRGSMCHTRIRTENRRRKADRLETLMRVFAARRLAYRAGL